jgi:hypothetical protein
MHLEDVNMKTFIIVYLVLMLPVIHQAHTLMKRDIDERIRNSIRYNLRVFIILTLYTPRWWWLFFVNVFNKFKKK